MNATDRYELIRPIVQGEKTVVDVHIETHVPISTLYFYLKRLTESGGDVSGMADSSRAPHSNPHWFTEDQKDQVVGYKLQHMEKSARQIAQELTGQGILTINYHTVADILKARHLAARFFFR